MVSTNTVYMAKIIYYIKQSKAIWLRDVIVAFKKFITKLSIRWAEKYIMIIFMIGKLYHD